MSEAQRSLVQTFPSSILYWGKELYQHRLHRVLFWSWCGYNILNVKTQYRFLMKTAVIWQLTKQVCGHLPLLCSGSASRLWGGCECLPTTDTTSSSLFPTPAGSQQTPEHVVEFSTAQLAQQLPFTPTAPRGDVCIWC